MLRLGRLKSVIARYGNRSSRERSVLIAVIAAWSILIVVGIVKWAQYEGAAGEAAIAPLQWPVIANLQRDERLATLVVALHPECPCSKATVSELSTLMAQSLHLSSKVRTYVIFLHLDAEDRSSVGSSLWNEASKIPGVEVIDDRNGALLRGFGALTSGQTYLYDTRGQLVFQGGITPVRGQTGINRGSLAIKAYLDSHVVADRRTPIYGCSLYSSPTDSLGE